MSAPLLEQYRRSIKKELCYLGGEGGRGWGVNLKEIVFENKDIRSPNVLIMILTSQETRPRVKCRLKKMIHQKEPQALNS